MEIAIDELKITRYSAYKDSGVEWLGEIPKEWECIRMKHLFKDISVKNRPDAELLSVTQNQGVVPRTWVENRMVMPSGALESFKFIHKGDFAISLRSFEGGLEYCHHDGIISPAYTVLKAQRNLDSQYYKYLFKSNAFISELQTSVVGIREGKNISYPELSYSFLPVPAKAIQTLVASFLDRKTALIYQAIGIKEKQIALLQERRQILIHQAVTRGLDPNVKMKDSGVEWIGEVPEEWEVVKMKIISEFVNDGTHGSYPRVDDGYRLLSVRNMVDDKFVFRDDDSRVSEKHFKEISSKFKILEGDIQLAIVGATLGKVAIVNSYNELFVTQRSVCTIRIKRNICSGKFLFYFMKGPSFQSYLWLNAGFSAQPGVYLGTIQNSSVPLPSLSEQTLIVTYLDALNLKYENAISLKEKEIEKLKEYKASLINSAVTGKIKVG
jgi:type I restriction enzyme, S subunit